MTEDRDLDRLLSELAEDGRGQSDPAEHPSDGTLSFYHARKLSPEEEDRVREHLVECKRCRDLLLEYAEFMGEDEEEKHEGVADLGAAANWRRLQEKMKADGKGIVIPTAALAPSRTRGGFHWQSIAAVLMAGIVGLSLYVWSLHQRLAAPEMATPQVFIPLTVRGEEGVVELTSGEEKSIPFTLQAPEASYSRYELRIVDSREQEVLSWRNLQKIGAEFNFTLDSKLFGPGVYEFKVFGLGSEDPVLLAKYTFRFIRRPVSNDKDSEGSSASR